MKKSPLLLTLAAVGTLLCSCTTSDLFVSRPDGQPLPGVVLEPVAVTYGCKDLCYTGNCGQVCVRDSQLVNLRREGFCTIYNVPVERGVTKHIIMQPTGLGERGGYQYRPAGSSK